LRRVKWIYARHFCSPRKEHRQRRKSMPRPERIIDVDEGKCRCLKRFLT
jgi:hypothetical protein